MTYGNYKLCKTIEAIDIVTSHMVGDKESYEAIFDDGSSEYVMFNALMDMRNDLEKQIWLNNHPEFETEL